MNTKVKNLQPYVSLVPNSIVINTYRILCDAFLKKYGKTKDCVELVKLYLMVFMQNSTTVQENGALVTYNLKESTSTTNIKGNSYYLN